MQTCSLSAPINVADVLHRLLPGRCGPAYGVTNRDMPVAHELRGAGAAVLRELDQWSAGIVFAATVRAAEQRLPGISVLHHACQAYRALSEVQRGEIVRALQHLPVTALMPDALLEALREVTRAIVPQLIQHIPDHDAVVLGLAAAALVCGLRSAPEPIDGSARTGWGPALRRVRLVVETLRGVRNLLSLAPGMSERLRLAGPETPLAASGSSLAAGNGTGVLDRRLPWDATGDHPHAVEILSAPLSAWPLGGAMAARGRGGGRGKAQAPAPGHRHRHGHKARAHATAGKSSSSTGRRVQINRRHGAYASDADRPRDYRGARGNHAARNPTAMSGHGEGQKESLQSPLSHSSNKALRDSSRTFDHDRNRYVQRGPGSQHGHGLPPARIKATPSQVAAGGSALDASGREAAARDRHAPAGAALHCVTFNDVTRTLDEVRRAGHRHSLPRFCMHPNAAGVFTTIFDGAGGLHWDSGHWMVTHTIHERVHEPLRAVGIWKSDINAHQPSPVVSTGSTLGNDTLFSVATISSSASLAQETTDEQDPRYLPRNTFRLMKYIDANGSVRLYMAYFICRDVPGERGLKAGFLPLHHARGAQATMHDMTRNLTITTDSLATLADVIETITGLTHHVAARPVHDDEFDDIQVEWALPLLVDEDTLSADPPHASIPYDAGLELFPVSRIKDPDNDRELLLYRNSFILVGHEILYADAEGRTGTLVFGYPRGDGGPSVLYGLGDGHEAFARRQGLEIGREYRVEDVIAQLDLRGMFAMPARDSHESSTEASVRSVPAEPAEPADDRMLLPSSFRFEAGKVRFRDHAGRLGTLAFDKAATSAVPGYRLQENQEALDLILAERLLLQQGFAYSEEDIIKRLNDEGFVRISD